VACAELQQQIEQKARDAQEHCLCIQRAGQTMSFNGGTNILDLLLL